MNTNGLYAVTHGEGAGCLAYWTLAGRVLASNLHAALRYFDEDFPRPTLPTEGAMLREAVQAVAGGRGSPYLRDRHPDGGWVVVSRHLESEDRQMQYESALHVWLNPEGQVSASDETNPVAGRIREEYQARVDHYGSEEVSRWLISVMAHLHAVSLRPRGGGFYYVPAAHVEMYRQVAEAMRMCSQHTLFEIPAMASTETAEAIIAALKAEVDLASDRTRAFCEDAHSRRGYQSQLDRLDALSSKLETYADFMDSSLESIEETLGHAQVLVTEGILKLDSDAA